ncbi:MAG: helix-turn-helix transcriptional regulator [Clostridiales bacterium]|nr:helix-turn-helix transcriptional regulator [Clostridiales bacterium]
MKEQTLAVQRMQDYIEANLDASITAADLARVSLFSPWHSYRLFKDYTGKTPAEYIRRLRLSKSAMKLKSENCRIIDIAFELGYGSVDGYQRAFFREFGYNPSDYAKNPVPITLFIPYGVKFRELRRNTRTMENIQSVVIQIMHKPERKVIIKRCVAAQDYFPYCEEVGCDVWGLLTSMDSLCGEPVCLWLTKQYKKPNTSTYVQGVEVSIDYAGPIPEGFDVITLPATEYLVFQGEPFEEEDYSDAILSVQHAINRYRPEAIGYQRDECSPRIQLEPIGERGYIELSAVKKKSVS